MSCSNLGVPLCAALVTAVLIGCRAESRPAAAIETADPAAAEEAIARDPRYPEHWWTPAEKDSAPGWEILPQEAGPGEVILSKRNELGLLSNFAATPFEFHGKRYASLEGFWQMMKYPEGPEDPRAQHPDVQWDHTRDEVAQMTAFEAKRAGDLANNNMQTMDIDWVTFDGKQIEYRPAEPGDHYRLIVEATREKVRQNPDVRELLLATGDLQLRPDHRQPRDATAAWNYHEILMELRGELQEESPADVAAEQGGVEP